MDTKKFLQSVSETETPYGTAVIWWFGQMGIWVKLGETVLSIDYFATELPGRTISPPVPASQVSGITAFLGSHNHIDHIDHPAWKIWANNLPDAKFIYPSIHKESLLRDGIEEERLLGINEGEQVQIGSVTVKAIAAAHEFLSQDPETGLYPALQYVIEGNGVRIYHAGDTLRYEGMISKLRAFGDFDAAILPINGRDAIRYRGHCIGNMTYQESVDLTGELKPKLVIPGHFDMFANNSEDPKKFADYLDAKYPGLVPCVIPQYLSPIIVKNMK